MKINGLDALLRILDSKSETKKLLAEIQAKIDELNERIALAGKARDIETLHIKAHSAFEEATADRAQAKEAAENAKTEAARVVADGVATVNAELHELNLTRKSLADERQGLEDWEVRLRAKGTELQKKLDVTAKAQEKAEAMMAQAEELMDMSRQNAALLQAAIDGMQK